MPLYLGLPIATALWLIVVCIGVYTLALICDFKDKIVKYNDLLNYAVQEELRKMKKEK